MGLALELAKRGWGRVSPNPMVGAVVVKGGQVIGQGWHQKYGGPHAEVHALREAGTKAKNATLYVTLEPCNRHGHVPPCTEAILAAGIRRVVVGARDNHSKGRGGIAKLKRARVRVDEILCEECEKLNEPFFVYTKKKRPYTVLKLASTLDGRIATRTGESKWITSAASRRYAHRKLRAPADAIAVGIETVLQDDPELTARFGSSFGRQPAPVVIDSRLRLPRTAKLLKTRTHGKFVVCSEKVQASARKYWERRGVKVVSVPRSKKKKGLDLSRAWKELAGQGVSSILVEGGGSLAWSLLDAGLADRVAIFYAPKILGCDKALPLVRGGATAKLSDAIQLKDVQVGRLGEDFVVIGKPVRKKKK